MGLDNTKYYLIAGAIAVVGGIGFVIYVLFFADTAPTDQVTQNGGNNIVQVSYPDNVKKALANPIEKIGTWSVLYTSDDYSIGYDSKSDLFAIDIATTPVLEKSKTAEQAFLNLLSVDNQYACSLSVSLKVPYSVDPDLSGYDFGMSFCPGKQHVEDIQVTQTTPAQTDNIQTKTIPLQEGEGLR